MTIVKNALTENATTTENENKRIWDTKLADVEAWKIARNNLNKWLDENEQGHFWQVLRKQGFQVLAVFAAKRGNRGPHLRRLRWGQVEEG